MKWCTTNRTRRRRSTLPPVHRQLALSDKARPNTTLTIQLRCVESRNEIAQQHKGAPITQKIIDQTSAPCSQVNKVVYPLKTVRKLSENRTMCCGFIHTIAIYRQNRCSVLSQASHTTPLVHLFSSDINSIQMHEHTHTHTPYSFTHTHAHTR